MPFIFLDMFLHSTPNMFIVCSDIAFKEPLVPGARETNTFVATSAERRMMQAWMIESPKPSVQRLSKVIVRGMISFSFR